MDGICPTCHVRVGKRSDGTFYPHKRYVDGGGWRPDQDHTMVACEGGQEEK